LPMLLILSLGSNSILTGRYFKLTLTLEICPFSSFSLSVVGLF
jgi:hypothetical protein